MKRRAASPARPTGAPPRAPAGAASWPGTAELFNPRGPFLIPLLLLLAARAAFWALLPHASEDAYITFRYARHLAVGAGPVYNPGERVMGFTSPVWTLWTSAGYALTRDPVLWSRSWTVVADVITLIGMGGLLRRHASDSSAWCFTFFFAAWPYFSALAVSGMEIGLLLALIVVAAQLAERGSRWTGAALAALALTRPEGVAAACVLALGARPRDRWAAAGIAAVGLAALGVYYGTPLPQSLHAKAQLYGTPGPWAGRGWWEWLSPFALGRWPSFSEATHMLPLTIVVAPACVVGTATLWRKRRSALALAIAAALLVWLAYSLLGVAYFWWYFAVPLAGAAALAAVGLPRLLSGRGVQIAMALYVLGSWTVVPILYLGRAQNEYLGFARVSNELSARVRPGDTVLLEPIGIIGYQNPVVVVDEVGLVSPEVARRRLQGAGWYTDVALARRPDWIVIRHGVLRQGTAFAGAGAPFRSAAERDSLFARYQLAAAVDPQSGDLALDVYRRLR